MNLSPLSSFCWGQFTMATRKKLRQDSRSYSHLRCKQMSSDTVLVGRLELALILPDGSWSSGSAWPLLQVGGVSFHCSPCGRWKLSRDLAPATTLPRFSRRVYCRESRVKGSLLSLCCQGLAQSSACRLCWVTHYYLTVCSLARLFIVWFFS